MSDIKNGVMNFFYKKEEGKCLSNFWKCIIVIGDEQPREYDSGESCFHGEKFIRLSKLCENKNRKQDLLKYGNKFLINVCKKDGGLIKMGKEELDLCNI